MQNGHTIYCGKKILDFITVKHYHGKEIFPETVSGPIRDHGGMNMQIDDSVMNGQERISFRLRSLYSEYGYERYRMSKFEEYDLYSRNKDFLFSEGVITFTDTNGHSGFQKSAAARMYALSWTYSV